MNLNGDEKRIRQLFRDLSLDEQRQAPQFANLLAAASSRASSPRERGWSWRFATAVAMIFAALLIAVIIIVKPTTHQDSAGDSNRAAVPLVPPENLYLGAPSQPPAPSVVPQSAATIRHIRRRAKNKVALTTASLFAWKSPTASLLQTPDDELLKSLPRLGEALRAIKPISPDQFN